MAQISLKSVGVSLNAPLFDDLTVVVGPGDRVGLAAGLGPGLGRGGAAQQGDDAPAHHGGMPVRLDRVELHLVDASVAAREPRARRPPEREQARGDIQYLLLAGGTLCGGWLGHGGTVDHFEDHRKRSSTREMI